MTGGPNLLRGQYDNLSACIRCGLCAQICPTNCITMQHYEPKLVKGELLVP